MKKRTASFAHTKQFQRLNARAAQLMRAGQIELASSLTKSVRASHRARALSLRGY